MDCDTSPPDCHFVPEGETPHNSWIYWYEDCPLCTCRMMHPADWEPEAVPLPDPPDPDPIYEVSR